MKISPFSITFKSTIADKKYTTKPNVLGYDDSCSQDTRAGIREFQEKKYFETSNILSSDYRLSEHEFKKLVSKMASKPKETNYRSVVSMPVANVEAINENSYRGASLVDDLKCVKTLKKSGIERVVDLVGYEKYKNAVLKEGMEYLHPQLGSWSNWFDEACFHTKESLFISRFWYITDPKEKEKAKADFEFEYPRDVAKTKAEIVNFIKFMQKDYLYIGCAYGTYQTDEALLVDYFLNPKTKVEVMPKASELDLVAIKNLYANLTPEDKKEMGWDEDFDKNFLKRVAFEIEEMEKFEKFLLKRYETGKNVE